MNRKTYESTLNGLNSTLKKVFEASPIEEAWTATAVSAEMRRRGSGGCDSRHTLGCLNQLASLGMLKESPKGMFQRVEIREKAEPVINKPKEIEVMTIRAIQPVTTQPATPIDRLSKFAIRLRELANDMETAALELAEQAEKNDAETAKMRQLQQILKSLG